MNLTKLYFIFQKFHLKWASRAQVMSSQSGPKETVLFYLNNTLG